MSSYVERNLSENEQVIYIAQLSLWPYAEQMLLGLVSLLLPLKFHSLVLMIPGLAIFVRLFILQRSVELAVTSRRIIVKTGIMKLSTSELYLSRVEGVEVQQSVRGRLLDYGTLNIRGVGTEIAPVKNVSAPLAFRKAFLSAVDRTIDSTQDAKGSLGSSGPR